jgi:hypothetical protein
VRNFKTEKSALAEHSCNLDHRIAWDRASILLKESREQQRKWEEAWEIAKTDGAIANRDRGRGFSPIRMYRFCQSTMNSDFSCIMYSITVTLVVLY